MPVFEESEAISGVIKVHLRSYEDSRGRFLETFRKEWFPQRSWDIVQSNRSDSLERVLRGLHYHHQQVDYWYVANGSIRAGLVDLRPSSRTFRHSQTIDISETEQLGLFIPVGVAHGYLALTRATVLYVVDNYYDGADEYGVAWNDPDLGLDWDTEKPTISSRDRNNPALQDIPLSDLPG